jgi:restriction system protein
MSLWLTRAGRHGEFEKRFLDDSRIYLTWTGLSHDLKDVQDKQLLRKVRGTDARRVR